MKLIEKIERKIVQKLLLKYPEYREVIKTHFVRTNMNTKKVSAECCFSVNEKAPSDKEIREELSKMIGRQIVSADLYKMQYSCYRPDTMTRAIRMVV